MLLTNIGAEEELLVMVFIFFKSSASEYSSQQE